MWKEGFYSENLYRREVGGERGGGSKMEKGQENLYNVTCAMHYYMIGKGTRCVECVLTLHVPRFGLGPECFLHAPSKELQQWWWPFPLAPATITMASEIVMET